MDDYNERVLKSLFRKLMDTPIFDALEDDVAKAHEVGVEWHPHWELQMRLDEEARWEAENGFRNYWEDDARFPF